ncbi:MAG: threonine--tRNA ligase [Candidatus Zambryskibacteria bacterium]|nr:threonine--tRNA ligase [Candidatus Zambryskibacteria bacterium]
MENDHRKIGREMDLFTFSDLVGSGLPLWTPKGTILRNLLDDFVWELRKEYGYEKVEIPHITKKDLYEASGHWDKFKEDLFHITTREGDEFALKPMNCPHHTQIYARKPWSYRELPQRYANSTMCYRDEQSGELNGLSRVRSFTQDDAHVFCRITDAKKETQKIWDIVHIFYNTFGLKLHLRLSLRDMNFPEKYLGNQKLWDKAEKILREIARENKTEYFEAPGEANFYAPKLDFMAKDSLKREWQVATIQLDVNMPERFDLTCVNEKGEKERIVMIHAAIMGSFERFLSIIIEHCSGNFPLWLSPVQVKVIPVRESHNAYAKKVFEMLKENNIRTELDDADENLGGKVRDAKNNKIPYWIVVGDKEMESGKVTLESRDEGGLGQMSKEEVLEKLLAEIRDKHV